MTAGNFNFSLCALGILAVRFEQAPTAPLLGNSREISAYCHGRAARLSNLSRDSYPAWLRADLVDHWQRGWDLVDYALAHPQKVDESDYR
jgi:hypothetical protein